MAFWNKWANVLVNPVKAFRNEMYKVDFSVALFHMSMPAVLTAVLSYFSVAGVLELYLAIIFSIAGAATVMLGWLLWSFLVYALSFLAEGKGRFTTQTYLIALYTAPLTILSLLLGFVPFGSFVSAALLLYSFYLLFNVIQAVHGFDTRKSAIIIILSLVLSFFILVTVSTIFSVLITSA